MTVSGGRDAAGNIMAPTSWTFRTSSDITAPTVSARLPASGAVTNVAVATIVRATFSEPVVAASAQLSLASPAGPVAGSLSYDPATRRLTLTPAAPLAWSTAYTATVSGADAAGNTMATTSWTFTTIREDVTAPTVTGRLPATNATNVDPATAVTATFSEPLVAGTVQMTLTAQRDARHWCADRGPALRTTTFTPLAPLGLGLRYTVRVTGARDTAGNVMTTTTSWAFTIRPPDTTRPTLTVRSPASNATSVDPATAVTATFSEPIVEGSVVMALSSSGGPVTGTLTYDGHTKGHVHSGDHTGLEHQVHRDRVGGRDPSGNVMTTTSWSFTTRPTTWRRR